MLAKQALTFTDKSRQQWTVTLAYSHNQGGQRLPILGSIAWHESDFHRKPVEFSDVRSLFLDVLLFR